MAIERNTIVLLETGGVKTQIAVLLMKYIAQNLKMEHKKCLIIFLVPAVALVKQQFEYIKKHTNLRVAYYIGGKAVKDWNEATLDEVLVMTPQILLDGLDSSSLTLDMVKLMILDECQHACKKHPYAKIMKVYQTMSQHKPKIFGMSASLVTKKGVSSSIDCEKQITQLEDILDAKVYTLKDMRELDSFVHTSQHITKYYSLSSQHHPLQRKLVSLPQFKDNEAMNIRANIEYCLDNLGLFCAYKAVQLYWEKEKLSEIVTGTVETEQYALDDYLKDAHKLLGEELPSDVNELFKTRDGIQNAVKGLILTPKVQLLVHLFLQKRDEDPKKVCCIVFVQRVIAAAVISSLLQQLDCLKHLKADFLSSVTSTFGSKKQQNALEDFSSDKVQVLVVTDVIEEGIDVKNCNCVICFDLPLTLHSYIQSRGCARQENSEFILFLERGNEKQEKQLFDIYQSVASMEDTILSRNDTSINEENTIEKDVPGDDDHHLPEMTSIRNVMASIEEQNVVEKDEESGDEVRDVGEDLGGVSEREDELEDVDEDEVEEKDDDDEEGKTSTKSGISKIKELHSITKVNALSDSWDEEERTMILQVYKLIFTSQCNDEKPYTNFALLTKAILDDGITNTEIDLFLTADKIVKAKLLQSGEMTFDLTQLGNAKDFQEIILNGIFGNLRNMKIITEMKNLWCSPYMYFLLPLVSDEFGVTGVDWKCIETCALRAREFRLLSTISEEDHNTIDIDNLKELPMVGSTNLILASDHCESSNLIDKAVVTTHNGMVYHVVKIIHGKTANSPFPLTKDSKPHYDSYSDYFQKKYGKKLKHLNQPLLLVKHAKQPRNFLAKHQQKTIVNAGNFVELPPELCLNLGVPSSVMKSLCLVPSTMHRLTSLMLASQLSRSIRVERPNCPPVSLQLIMEALTSHKCLECFSYERLELLGDSFLKYAISEHLFMKYKNEDEGQLSARRAEAVCNTTLHRLALDRNLQGYIIDELFDVRKWVAPGLFCRSIVPCSCNPRDPNSLQMGKACDKGHRWMYSKTISDVVEALIGAHLVGGDTIAAIEFMKWMNMEVDIEDKSEIAFNPTFAYPCVLNTSLDELQSLLNYHFENPFLLVESITHASINEHGGCSYQRLEFLGDSVLDLLITRHLYSTYQELSPGTLSDLRQVAVNNENFAQVTVKHNIQNYLRHNSDELKDQIAKFVEAFEQHKGGDCQFISFGGGMHAPKVLGDLIESISGAILVDTRFKLNVVWDKMKPILSPIVTPENMELHPLRELYELCFQQHYKYNWKHITKEGNVNVATVQIQLKESVIHGEGSDTNKRSAKTKAAKHVLARLQGMGIYHDRNTYVRSSMDVTGNETPHASNLIAQEKMIIASSPRIDSGEVDMVVSLEQCHRGETTQEENLSCSSKPMQGKDPDPLPHMKSTNEKDNRLSTRKHKLEEGKEGICTTEVLTHEDVESDRPKKRAKKVCSLPIEEGKEGICTMEMLTHEEVESNRPKQKAKKVCSLPVCIFLSSQRGGHRRNLYELCQKMHCREPQFELIEKVGMPHESRFLFKVVVDIPNKESLSIQGEQKRDHASAKDSAAYKMLVELQKHGLCSIKTSNNDCENI